MNTSFEHERAILILLCLHWPQNASPLGPTRPKDPARKSRLFLVPPPTPDCGTPVSVPGPKIHHPDVFLLSLHEHQKWTRSLCSSLSSVLQDRDKADPDCCAQDLPSTNPDQVAHWWLEQCFRNRKIQMTHIISVDVLSVCVLFPSEHTGSTLLLTWQSTVVDPVPACNSLWGPSRIIAIRWRIFPWVCSIPRRQYHWKSTLIAIFKFIKHYPSHWIIRS